MMMKLISWATLFAALLPSAGAGRFQQHSVEISNDSKEGVVVDWYNPSTGKPIEFSHLQAGESVRVNSFANHTFFIRSEADNCTADESCRVSTLIVNDNDEQVVKVKEGLQVEHRDSTSKAKFTAMDIVAQCNEIAKLQLGTGRKAEVVMKEMADCVETKTAESIQHLHEKQMFEKSLRESVSSKLENYTCADPTLESTKTDVFRQWEDPDGVSHKVHVIHDRKASKIHLLENFITEEECAAIEAAAKPILHHGTVADGKGGSRLSDHRKAMQAGVKIPWDEEKNGNPVPNYFRRIYAYANNATGYGIEVTGQEDLMSIQYFGRGESDKAPDQYRPHGDGDVDGRQHVRGSRVATMVAYCTADNLIGGATNFGNANVYVKPKVGAAAFFSYMDNETGIHDDGFTSHSGCPVIQGVKRIAVHWMRVGVTAEEPWDSFNTLNIPKAECDDDV